MNSYHEKNHLYLLIFCFVCVTSFVTSLLVQMQVLFIYYEAANLNILCVFLETCTTQYESNDIATGSLIYPFLRDRCTKCVSEGG
jgi:hypothetical protein